MPLDPHLQSRLHLIADFSFDQIDDPEALAKAMGFLEDPEPWQLPDVDIDNSVIDGPHGPIPIRIYTPRTRFDSALLWVHGGGFVGGDLDMAEAHVVAAELCDRGSTLVVSVDYRLAVNGVRYPVPLDDVHTAWRWLVDTWARSVTRLVMGGASAGGALALATALRERDAAQDSLDALLLAYPFTHFPNPALDPTTAEEMATLPPVLRFSVPDIEKMVTSYVGRITNLPVDALPGAADLRGLPPTRVIVSEYDDLRSSAELLVRQLIESGVDTSSLFAPGMPHGHLNRTPSLSEVGRSLDYFAAALRPDQPASTISSRDLPVITRSPR